MSDRYCACSCMAILAALLPLAAPAALERVVQMDYATAKTSVDTSAQVTITNLKNEIQSQASIIASLNQRIETLETKLTTLPADINTCAK